MDQENTSGGGSHIRVFLGGGSHKDWIFLSKWMMGLVNLERLLWWPVIMGVVVVVDEGGSGGGGGVTRH